MLNKLYITIIYYQWLSFIKFIHNLHINKISFTLARRYWEFQIRLRFVPFCFWNVCLSNRMEIECLHVCFMFLIKLFLCSLSSKYSKNRSVDIFGGWRFLVDGPKFDVLYSDDVEKFCIIEILCGISLRKSCPHPVKIAIRIVVHGKNFFRGIQIFFDDMFNKLHLCN